MLPRELIESLDANPRVDARNPGCLPGVDRALTLLWLTSHEDIVEFYRRYDGEIAPYDASFPVLHDIASPKDSVLKTTLWLHENFGLDRRYVAISSFEGGGGLVIDSADGHIHDIGFEDVDAINAGQHKPMWRDIVQMLYFYSDPSKDNF